DYMSLGAETDSGTQRLTGEHMGTVQFSGNYAVEQNFPVGLGFKFHGQIFIVKVAALISHGEGHHVGEFDKAEFQIFFFGGANRCLTTGAPGDGSGESGKNQRTKNSLLQTFGEKGYIPLL